MFEYAAKLIRIIDGDTLVAALDLGFKIHKVETVRLSGINTPESRTRNLEEKRHGLAAKKALGDLITSAGELVVKVAEVGKYGRALGTIYADGVNVNFELIDRGYAYPYDGQRKLDYSQMLARYGAMENIYKKLKADD